MVGMVPGSKSASKKVLPEQFKLDNNRMAPLEGSGGALLSKNIGAFEAQHGPCSLLEGEATFLSPEKWPKNLPVTLCRNQEKQ